MLLMQSLLRPLMGLGGANSGSLAWRRMVHCSSWPWNTGLKVVAAEGVGLGILRSRQQARVPRVGLAMAGVAGDRGFISGLPLRSAFPKRDSESPDQQQVHLGCLADNPGARKPKRRVARGTGSGRGKTAGRGHKGQKSRSGNKGLMLFQGGQTPLQKLVPKRGFSNRRHAYISEFDGFKLNRLLYFINSGRLDISKMITMKNLRDCGACNPKVGIKLLAGDVSKVKVPIMIEVSDVSKQAREIVEKAGGSVKIAYYNRLGFRALLKPEKFITIPRRAAPPPRLMWKYPEHYKDVEAQMAARDAHK